MLDLDSLLVCVGVVGFGVSDCAGRLQADPGVSAKRLDFRAASQSKGDFTEVALSGERGE